MVTPTPSDLDYTQCLQGAYDNAAGAFRVEAQITAPLDINGDVLVDVRASDGDSVLVYGTTDGTTLGPQQVLKVNSDGSINITGSTTVAGTVNTNLNGLNNFQTSQYTIGITAIQLTPTPLSNRSSVSIKAILTGVNIVYIGNSSSVTTSTGYPLFNGDSVQFDLTASQTLYAIATGASQTICVAELG